MTVKQTGAAEAGDTPVLVIGATGQIAESLLARLWRNGRPALALSRRPAVLPGDAGTALPLDLESADLGLGGHRAEHAVATIPLWLLPARMPALAEAGVRRLACFGSTSIFGKQGSRDAREMATVRRLEEAEAALWAASDRLGIATTLLRPNLIYGLGRDRNVTAVARFADRFGWFPVAPPARGLRQPVHAADLADAALSVLARPETAGRAFNLGGGETLTFRDMVARVFLALERRPRLVPMPGLGLALSLAARLTGNTSISGEMARRMNRDLAFDDGSAHAAFGYAPRPFLAGGRADLGPAFGAGPVPGKSRTESTGSTG